MSGRLVRFVTAFVLLSCALIEISGAAKLKCFSTFNKKSNKCRRSIAKDVSVEDCCAMPNAAGYTMTGGKTDCRACPGKGPVKWNEWGAWSPCSVTCGEGKKARWRTCSSQEKKCKGKNRVVKRCQTPTCPVELQWNSWGSWTPCSVTCGQGVVVRVRTCPEEGKCKGDSKESQECKKSPCPVDGGWSPWSPWGPCSQTCGKKGFHYSTRRCTNPRPAHGGKKCEGRIERFKACTDIPEECPIDGNWGHWGRWGDCQRVDNSTNCYGIQVRTRQCNDPAPQHGGKNCPDVENASKEQIGCKPDCGDESGSGSGGSARDQGDDTEAALSFEGDDFVFEE